MKAIPGTPLPDKVILVHHGALGDFLNVWPSVLALRAALPRASLHWAGSAERMRWLAPLGVEPCPPQARRALDRCHAAVRPPEELEDHACFWFVVDRIPDVPRWPGLHFARALSQSLAAPGGPHPAMHVRDHYALDMGRAGIPALPGWLGEFRRLFATARAPGDRALLFPGAGHPLKQWPLVQYFQLADMLRARSLEPVFVLGPAEIERGLVPQGLAALSPASLAELEGLLLTARLAIGADTGPMHLAGMLGVPGVSLFGPTSFAQWGPVGMAEAALGLACSPCTQTCADLCCPQPRCLAGLTPAMVMEKLEIAMDVAEAKCKTGFQGPGIP